MKLVSIILITTLVHSCSEARVGIDRTKHISEKKVIVEAENSGPTKPSENFQDVTEEMGLSQVKATFLSVVDINRDFFPDLVFLKGLYSHPEFYLYDRYLKKYVPIEYEPFEKPIEASSMLFYDFDKDGIVDVLTSVFNYQKQINLKKIRIFKGYRRDKKLYFIELSGKINLASSTSSISVLDYNKDGFLDLYVGNWFLRGNMQGDRFYAGSGLTFTDKTKGAFPEPKLLNLPTLATSICDVNRDGKVDVLTSSSRGYENILWQNIGKKFKDIGKETYYSFDFDGLLKERGGGRTQFSSCYDYNKDGYYDIFMGELNYSIDSEDSDRSSILTYSPIKDDEFKYLREEIILEDYPTNVSESYNRGVWGDFNLDGKVDLLINNSGYPPHSRLILLQQQGRDWVDTAEQLGLNIVNPNHTVVLDYNKDGKPDILTAQMNVRNSKIPSRVYLFKNNVQTDRKLVRIKLWGDQANKEAIGTQLKFIVGDHEQRIFYKLTEGFLSPQHEPGVFYSFGKDEHLKSFQILWPHESINGISGWKEYDLKFDKKPYQEFLFEY